MPSTVVDDDAAFGAIDNEDERAVGALGFGRSDLFPRNLIIGLRADENSLVELPCEEGGRDEIWIESVEIFPPLRV